MLSRSEINSVYKKIRDKLYDKVPTLAVSGGVDSIVLMNIFDNIDDIRFNIAHYNHNQNHADDYYEEAVGKSTEFIRNVYHFRSFHAGNQFKIDEKNFENRARKARYNEIARFAKEKGSSIIVTGHNLDDQIETILMGMARGIPIDKVAMAELTYFKKSDIYIYRPMLKWLKKDIIDLAIRWKLEWIEDITNVDQKYERNYYRHTVIPAMNTRRNIYKGIIKSVPIHEYIEVEDSQLFNHFI